MVEPIFPQKWNEGVLPKAKDKHNSPTYFFVVVMPGPKKGSNYRKKLTSNEVESLKEAGTVQDVRKFFKPLPSDSPSTI